VWGRGASGGQEGDEEQKPPRSQHLLSRGLETTDQYIAACRALISDITGGK
jgi:hypothetical protein